ncbi:MAG: rhomboid family intramembrane serine protease [Oscillospiraceae bacterium]|nr:rhomboid family intramembrane serine protease [Oscillospiraceae bacterium]
MLKKLLGKFQYNSPVILTFTLLALCAVLLNYITNGWSNRYIFSVYRTKFYSPMQYLRMFTHVIGHVNYAHFIGNFTIILLIGPMLEEKYGSRDLIEMIAVTAFVTGLIQVIFFPHVALLGASGIAFMLILLSSFANYQKGRIPITLILVAVIYLSGEIIEGIRNPHDNISQMAHIVGGVCGTLFGWAITKPSRQESSII